MRLVGLGGGADAQAPPPHAYLRWLLQSQSLGLNLLRRSWATTSNPSHGATKRWTIHWHDHYRKQNHSTWKAREQFHLVELPTSWLLWLRWTIRQVPGWGYSPEEFWRLLRPSRWEQADFSVLPCIQYHDSWPKIYHKCLLRWEAIYAGEYVSCDICFC